MRRCWVGTSWKMHKTLAEGLAFAEALAVFAPAIHSRIEPFVLPSFTSARDVKRALAPTRVKVGAQNMHWADEGAWTGEVSPLMLRDCDLDLVELGHSERRRHFGETDHAVGLKVEAALRHGLVPLICVGETREERDGGLSEEILARQTRAALQFLHARTVGAAVLFAYEPVWAIGEGGMPASADYANDKHGFIKSIAESCLGSAPPVLYGGSVNPGNASDMMRQQGIDGLFIGRAAWQANDFIQILKIVGDVLDG